MTRPGIEPRSPGPLANTLTARPMSGTTTLIHNEYKTNTNFLKRVFFAELQGLLFSYELKNILSYSIVYCYTRNLS